jgi:hypothetical protein
LAGFVDFAMPVTRTMRDVAVPKPAAPTVGNQ